MRTKITCLWLFLCAFFLSNHWTYAAETNIDLVIPSIPENLGTSDTQLEGPHGKVIQDVLTRIDGKVSYLVAHPNHAYAAFQKQKYTCVTPDSIQYYDPRLNLIESSAIHTSNWVVVQRQDTAVFSKRDDLLNKRVGTLYRPEELFNIVPQAGTHYIQNSKLQLLLKMLSRNRVDAVIVPQLGLKEAIKESKLPNLTFTKSPPIAQVANAVMCHNTPRGQEIVDIFNKHLKNKE